jgi:hypothetical protein
MFAVWSGGEEEREFLTPGMLRERERENEGLLLKDELPSLFEWRCIALLC